MKRVITLCLALGLSTAFVVGCGEKAKTEKKTTTSTPGGTTTETQSKEVKQTGDNPPPPKQ